MMFNPPHPGETLRELYLDGLEMTITDAANALNMPRSALSEIVNGKRSISPTIAIKLSKAFGGSAESWLHQQADYDLWNQKKSYSADDIEVIYTQPQHR